MPRRRTLGARPPVVVTDPQRHAGDCGLVALAQALGIPYEDVFQACPEAGRDGLRTQKSVDLDEDTGILGVEFATHGHWVYISTEAASLIPPKCGIPTPMSRTVPFQMSSSSSKLAYNLDPSKGGVKADTNKLCWHLLPYAAVAEVVAVLQVGAEKYSQWNWLGGMPYSRCFNSAQRHLLAWWTREDNDPESGLSHLAHAACNLLFLLTFALVGKGEDDRPEMAVPRSIHKSGVPL